MTLSHISMAAVKSVSVFYLWKSYFPTVVLILAPGDGITVTKVAGSWQSNAIVAEAYFDDSEEHKKTRQSAHV